jgi:hypothetical protein
MARNEGLVAVQSQRSAGGIGRITSPEVVHGDGRAPLIERDRVSNARTVSEATPDPGAARATSSLGGGRHARRLAGPRCRNSTLQQQPTRHTTKEPGLPALLLRAIPPKAGVMRSGPSCRRAPCLVCQ